MLRARSFASTLVTSSLVLVSTSAVVACGTADDGGMEPDFTSDDSGTTTQGTSSTLATNTVAPVGPTSTNSSPNTSQPNTSQPNTAPSNQTNTEPSTSSSDTSNATNDTTATSMSEDTSDTNTTSGQVEPGTDSTDLTETTGSDNTSSDNTSDTTDTTEPPGDGSGFYVADGKLFDVNGVEFIMRGVNYPYVWFKDSQNTQQMFADIATTGANVVRVVMATGGQWTRTSGSEVSDIISWAKANKLVAMLEVHDATGYGDNEAPHPNVALDYWTMDDVATAIKGQEAYVLLNIANESFGNDSSQEWEEFYEAAVGELRAAGLHHTLVVDAPFWGQDWGNCMRDGSTTNPREMTCDANLVFDADPEANTMFSVHMYDVYGQSTIVSDYFDKFLMRGLPFVVGEFAADHGPGKEVDEAAIMQLAEERKVGYIGWSWSGNSTSPTDLSSLDITVGFNLAELTTWGDTLINGANGLKETGVACTCFD